MSIWVIWVHAEVYQYTPIVHNWRQSNCIEHPRTRSQELALACSCDSSQFIHPIWVTFRVQILLGFDSRWWCCFFRVVRLPEPGYFHHRWFYTISSIMVIPYPAVSTTILPAASRAMRRAWLCGNDDIRCRITNVDALLWWWGDGDGHDLVDGL